MTEDQASDVFFGLSPEGASSEATCRFMLFLYGERADSFVRELLNDDAVAAAPDTESDRPERQLPAAIITKDRYRGSDIARPVRKRWQIFPWSSVVLARTAASIACLVVAWEAARQVYFISERDTAIVSSPISSPPIDLAGGHRTTAAIAGVTEFKTSLPTAAYGAASRDYEPSYHAALERSLQQLTRIPMGGATRTWVSGVGDDVNPCSRTAPCKTFAGAISKTIANGEVNCLDPGGFGAVTITKSISIRCGELNSGTLAGAHTITIDAGATDTVTLRGLTIEGLGREPNGIDIRGAAMVMVDSTRINGFTSDGINFRPANESASLYVKNTFVTGNRYRVATSGILIRPSSDGNFGVRIDGSRVQRAAVGIRVDSSAVSAGTVSAGVYGSRLEHNTGDGLLVDARFGYASAWLDDAIVANNGGIGLRLLGTHGTLASENSLVFQNAVGNVTPNVSAEYTPRIAGLASADPIGHSARAEFARAVSTFGKQVAEASKSIDEAVQSLSNSGKVSVERKMADVGSIRKIIFVLLTELEPNAPLAQAADRLDSWTLAQMTRLNSERSAFSTQDVETLVENYRRSRQAILSVRDMMVSHSHEIVVTLERLRRAEDVAAERLLSGEALMAADAIKDVLPGIQSSIGRVAEVRAKVLEIDRTAPSG
jgi:hypothetical protein